MQETPFRLGTDDYLSSSNGAFLVLFITSGLVYVILISHYLAVSASPMVTQTDIPSDLTDDSKAFLFQTNDAVLNSGILYALLHDEERRSVS